MLILTLPQSSSAAPEYDYVLSSDGQQVTAQGRAGAALLPAAQGRSAEVVAVIPAQALSWHGVQVPQRVLRGLLPGRAEAARVRSVLAGVLEDRLLDEPEHLHFAVFASSPGETREAADSPNAWVAVCSRSWLQGQLQLLDAAGRTVTRLVAEGTPTPPGTANAVLCDGSQPTVLLCSPQGVSTLPLQGASVELARTHDGLTVQAEPAVMALAEHHFGQGVVLRSHAERMLQAAQSPWNLAQLEQSASRGDRWAKRLGAGWQQLLRGPRWQAARWTLVALLLVQLVGLNVLAWQMRSQQQATRLAIQGVLQQSFPGVQLVVDAPQQMQRAVDDLARTRSAGADALPPRVLATLAAVAPADFSISSLDWDGQQLQLKGSALDEASSQRLRGALTAQGLHGQWQNGQLQVTRQEGKP